MRKTRDSTRLDYEKEMERLRHLQQESVKQEAIVNILKTVMKRIIYRSEKPLKEKCIVFCQTGDALSVSARTLPKLPVLYKTNAIASSFGASNIATMTGTMAAPAELLFISRGRRIVSRSTITAISSNEPSSTSLKFL
jgi:hypothetical protein